MTDAPTPTMERDSLVARLTEYAGALDKYARSGRVKCWPGDNIFEDAAGHMREAAAALSRPEQVVMALEWQKPVTSGTMNRADTILGYYRVWTHYEANGEWFWSVRLADADAAIHGECNSEAAAKAAAQADYESRILSCLTTAAPLQAVASAPASPAIGVQVVKAREAMRHSKSLLTDLRIGQGIQNERFPDNKIEGALWDAIPSVVAELDAALAALSQEPVPSTAEERAASKEGA